MHLPINIRRTKKCQRCGLRYPKKETQCSHCSGLTDQQVAQLKEKFEAEQAGNADLGRLFLYIAGLILVGMLILVLNAR